MRIMQSMRLVSEAPLGDRICGNFNLKVNRSVSRSHTNTAVSRKVVQQKSIKAYATIPKGMMGCDCSLLHRQVHEFSARWKAVL